jgi:hypothetical protein
MREAAGILSAEAGRCVHSDFGRFCHNRSGVVTVHEFWLESFTVLYFFDGTVYATGVERGITRLIPNKRALMQEVAQLQAQVVELKAVVTQRPE